MRYHRLGALITGLILAAASASAEVEDGLYGAAVPADAVFIRPLGLGGAPVSAFGRTFQPDELSDGVYTAISAQALEGAVPGAYVSLVHLDGEMHLIEEPARDDRTRVHLFLLNAGADAARLVVADGGPEVIAATPSGQIDSRAVNPLALTLAVETGGQAQTFDVVLRRGVNVTFLVAQDGVQLIPHQFGPVVSAD
jgi:hypothetical protein